MNHLPGNGMVVFYVGSSESEAEIGIRDCVQAPTMLSGDRTSLVGSSQNTLSFL